MNDKQRVFKSNVNCSSRMCMHDLTPSKNSRKTKVRLARGYGGKGGGTGGRGTRGQKSRSGGGVRPGFEGGQLPLYRRLPKLKGIAGGMTAGVPDYVKVNVDEFARLFKDKEVVSKAALKNKGIIKCSGRNRRLPLKVLGRGSSGKPLTVEASAFSASARATIEAAGGTCVEHPKY